MNTSRPRDCWQIRYQKSTSCDRLIKVTVKRLFCVVPTTGGPNAVRGLTQRRDLPASVVFQNSNFRPLSWSRDYDQFLLPSGPVRSLIQNVAEGAFVMRVDDDIDGGRSWEVPMLLTHFAVSSGHLISPNIEAADVLLWSTGALDYDDGSDIAAQKIAPQDYALNAKIEASRALFAQAAQHNVHIIIALPDGRGSQEAERLLATLLSDLGCSHRITQSGLLDAAITQLSALARNEMVGLPALAEPRAVTTYARPNVSVAALIPSSIEPLTDPLATNSSARQFKRVALACCLVLACACSVAAYMMTGNHKSDGIVPQAERTPASLLLVPNSTPEPARVEANAKSSEPTAPVEPVMSWLVLTELRSPEGMSCLDVIAQSGEFVRVPVVVVEDNIIASKMYGLCGLEYASTGDAKLELDSQFDNITLRTSGNISRTNQRRVIFSARAAQLSPIQIFQISITKDEQKRSYRHQITRN
jgi:hypothetical protein